MDKIPLSLCVITLNEETHIQKCLASVPFASDVVVLDSGSTDQTQTLALQAGARFFSEPWKGFGPQKQRAVELAQYDWVLCLDADEALSEELQKEIWTLMQNPPPGWDGFKLPRRSYHLGRWLRFGGWYPDYQTRLFSKKTLRWSSEALHESVSGGKIGTLRGDLLHYPFESLADQIQTNNRYSTLGAEVLQTKGQKFHFWHLIMKPWGKFMELYFFKQGFRDGWAGYIIAVGGAYSYFLKYAKLWEKQNLFSRKAE